MNQSSAAQDASGKFYYDDWAPPPTQVVAADIVDNLIYLRVEAGPRLQQQLARIEAMLERLLKEKPGD